MRNSRNGNRDTQRKQGFICRPSPPCGPGAEAPASCAVTCAHSSSFTHRWVLLIVEWTCIRFSSSKLNQNKFCGPPHQCQLRASAPHHDSVALQCTTLPLAPRGALPKAPVTWTSLNKYDTFKDLSCLFSLCVSYGEPVCLYSIFDLEDSLPPSSRNSLVHMRQALPMS